MRLYVVRPGGAQHRPHISEEFAVPEEGLAACRRLLKDDYGPVGASILTRAQLEETGPGRRALQAWLTGDDGELRKAWRPTVLDRQLLDSRPVPLLTVIEGGRS